MYNEDEEYELSVCSETAFKALWPEALTPAHPSFQLRMYELQLHLIECKLPFMFIWDKRRALNTVRFLKEEIRKGLTQD